MNTTKHLDLAFAALSDPTRRALLARLGADGELSVSELARPIEMSLPAVMKHIAVLEGAGLVEREKIGRTVHCRLNTGPMQDAIDWLERTSRFWQQRLDSLARFVEEDDTEGAGRAKHKRTPRRKGT